MLLSFGVSWGSVALADGVRETNYQQGRLETTHTLIGSLRPEHSLDVRSRDGVIRAVGGSDVAEGNPLSIVKETDGRRAIVLHFDKAARHWNDPTSLSKRVCFLCFFGRPGLFADRMVGKDQWRMDDALQRGCFLKRSRLVMSCHALAVVPFGPARDPGPDGTV